MMRDGVLFLSFRRHLVLRKEGRKAETNMRMERTNVQKEGGFRRNAGRNEVVQKERRVCLAGLLVGDEKRTGGGGEE
jgi:hypothetical protein